MDANKIQIKTIIDKINLDKKQYIEECEENFNKEIRNIAQKVVSDRNIKFVLLAGPSSSGKTTTSKIIADEIEKNGFHAFPMSLDDFFLEHEDTPLWEDGSYNFETHEALDWECFGECVKSLLAGKPTLLPIFDFVAGHRVWNEEPTVITENTIVVLEGLHALHPIIDNFIPTKNGYKIFISTNTDIYDGDEIFINHKQVRFYRRLIRDLFSRNISIERTMKNWEKVNRGEELYIGPYVDTADYKIDSFHQFELGVYNYILNENKNFDTDSLSEAVGKINQFSYIDPKLLPKTSVLQEFVPNK